MGLTLVTLAINPSKRRDLGAACLGQTLGSFSPIPAITGNVSACAEIVVLSQAVGTEVHLVNLAVDDR